MWLGGEGGMTVIGTFTFSFLLPLLVSVNKRYDVLTAVLLRI